MTLEEKLASWTGPSSDSEQEKQERAERMVREAVASHSAFDGVGISIFAKGSYANNTNVRADSDVDIAVECTEVCYWEEGQEGAHPPASSYTGKWTPTKLRTELDQALRAKFPGQVDSSGSVALRVNANTSRVDADVVPCFTYKYYLSPTAYRQGTRVFRTDGSYLDNYPKQQLDNGVVKNRATHRSYKRTVRILKRTENALANAGLHKELPSYFMECLAYNCPDYVLLRSTWTETIKAVLAYIYNELDGQEPSDEASRWLEVNGIKFLFHPSQPWTRGDAQSFAKTAWDYLELS